MAPDPGYDVTRLLHGELSLLQPRQGYRFAMDPLVLAGFCRLEPGWSVLDLGAGNGVLGLLLAKRFPETRFTLLELQEGLADLAGRNIAANGLEGRLRLVRGDLRRRDLFAEKSFQALVTNPPYLPLGSGRLGPDPERNLARHEIECTLGDWTGAATPLAGQPGAPLRGLPGQPVGRAADRPGPGLPGPQEAAAGPRAARGGGASWPWWRPGWGGGPG